MKHRTKPYEITQKQFNIFKNECHHWIDILSMHNWEVSIFQCDIEGTQLADTIPDSQTRMASIRCNTMWRTEPTEYELCSVAFHEVLEVLFEDVECLVNKSLKEDARREVHKLINTLSHTLFLEDYKGRKRPIVEGIVVDC